MYLLYDDATREALVIDPAIDSGEAFARMHELENAGYTLVAIWNTHGHFDHVYDNARWKSAFDVPIWMHSADNFLIEHLREQSIWLGLPAPEVARPITIGKALKPRNSPVTKCAFLKFRDIRPARWRFIFTHTIGVFRAMCCFRAAWAALICPAVRPTI